MAVYNRPKGILCPPVIINRNIPVFVNVPPRIITMVYKCHDLYLKKQTLYISHQWTRLFYMSKWSGKLTGKIFLSLFINVRFLFLIFMNAFWKKLGLTSMTTLYFTKNRRQFNTPFFFSSFFCLNIGNCIRNRSMISTIVNILAPINRPIAPPISQMRAKKSYALCWLIYS